MGYTALLLFGGLVMIPKSFYEAASLDGASEWHMFRTVTLPLLRPVLALVLVVTIVGSFQVFDTVQVATGGIGGAPGGPANASRVMYLYIFQQAFEFNDLGYASALSVALIALLVAVAAFQLRLLRAGESDLA
jgi:multiple sugar transport system permease protein